MSELFEKSIQTLELPRVLEMLAACAVTDEGKERALSLRPMTDLDDIQREPAIKDSPIHQGIAGQYST